MSNKEERIQEALDDFRSGRFQSISQSAAFHDVPRSTLNHRNRGRDSLTKADRSQQRLTNEQERVVVQWIRDLQRQYLNLNYIRIREVVVQLLRQNGDHRPLGKHWITNFQKRHPGLSGGYTKAMEMKRLTALSIDVINPFFDEVETLQAQYNVPRGNILNMDEKGFHMGQSNAEYCLFDTKEGPPLTPNTGNTKWVTAIECVTADGRAMKPMIIFIGNQPQTGWWPATETLPDWVWAFSAKGWTDNELAVDWLDKVLIPHTQQSQDHFILILDGHKSHATGLFQFKCGQNRIHLVWLPPHASYKLQPLDVGPFSRLADVYGAGVRKYTPSGYATINRATFTTLYQEIRPQALTERNIRAGWQRAGLWPLNRERIYTDPQVANFGRTTPDYQPPQLPEGEWATPKRVQDFQEIGLQLEAVTTPSKHVPIQKLIKAGVQELTANTILSADLREIRSHAVDKEINARTERLQKEKEQRSWDLQQIIQAREGLGHAGKAKKAPRKKGKV
jgi:hypothetical protein